MANMKSGTKRFFVCILFSVAVTSCAPAATAISTATMTDALTATITPPSFTPLFPTDTPTLTPSATLTPTATATPSRTPTETITPIPTVASLKATVTADPLSCRYGPGPEYLFLYGLRKGANIKLIGRTDGNNWVWVDGKNKCWVNKKLIEIQGDPAALPIVYPGNARLPISPYYPPTDWVGATRNKNMVEVSWNDVPLRAGDEEDESMLHYIIEVWRCEGGQIIFDPLATNDLSIAFVDEPGCSQPSHGRVFVQEKHGFAGPTEIPWPPYTAITPTP